MRRRSERLLGEYRHKMDAKGRLSPLRLSGKCSHRSQVTPDPENQCLYVFEVDDYSNWVEGLFEGEGGFDVSSKRKSALRKVLNSRVRNCEVDNSGRIHLTPAQREIAGLDKDVVFVGDEDHFEIWDAKRWDDFVGSVDLASLMSES